MISTDDHPPPDPSSSDYQNLHRQQQQQLQISHDFNINSDEKTPASVSVADLLKSSAADLDDTNKPLPNFSIRDYVFSSRSKDIRYHWPFSRKSLQLCVQYGVKNLLPPFQPIDSPRDNSPVRRCTFEVPLPNEEIVSSFDGKPTSNLFVSNQELASEFVSTKLRKPKGVKESKSRLEEELVHTKSKKSKFSKSNSSVKEPVEEVTPNNLIVSESMASKKCPVCKTFSSSSNTTLNAHIDQCLSGESTMKWSANPKIMVKHRIKPRKTRLMVDVYKTALYCTIDELDRRNGTSWATNSSFPAQELKFQGEEDKEEPPLLTVSPEASGHEGAVYIDTDGTKIRILSVPKVGTSYDHEACRLQKGGNGRKNVMAKKKKKVHGHKHHRKYLKLTPNSKNLCSLKPHHRSSDQARTGRVENVSIEESTKEGRGKQPMKARIHTKMDNLAVMRPPWACSKRTGLSKKFNSKDCKLSLKHTATKDLRVERDKSSYRCGTSPSSFDNTSSSQSSKKLDTSSKSSKKLDTSSKSSKKLDTSSPCGEQPLLSNMVVNFSSGSPVEKMYSGDDIKKIVIGHNKEDQVDDIENQGSYFQDVDPILIPGPPGSFLPSPGGDMAPEEPLQGNSSWTTTSRAQSNEDPHSHETMDRGSMSDSPISAISNPSLARSDSRSSDKLSVRSTSLPDTRPEDVSVMVDVVKEKSARLISSPNDPDCMLPTSFLNNQPCCCSRKESVSSQIFASNYQETMKTAPDASVKLPVYHNCDSAVGPSKPVLRLMGKNLTVMKTNDDLSSPPLGPTPDQHTIIFSHNQNGSESQQFSFLRHADFRPVNAYDTRFPSTMTKNGANASPKPIEEIVVIDDSSGNEAEDAMFTKRLRRNQASSTASIPFHMPNGYNNNYPPRHMNHLYASYQSQNPAYPLYVGNVSPIFQDGRYQTFMADNGNLGRWKYSNPSSVGPR